MLISYLLYLYGTWFSVIEMKITIKSDKCDRREPVEFGVMTDIAYKVSQDLI